MKETIEEKKINIVKSLINVALLLIICVVSGCLDFMKWQFHIERIFMPVFWIQTGLKFTYLICAKMIGMNLFEDMKRKSNINLQENKNRYEKLNKMRGADFPVWVETELNPRIKKDKYIKGINKKISVLDKFTNNRYRLLYVLNEAEREAIISCYKKESWKKRANKYLTKRKRFEDLKNEDFLDKNINYINVPFCKNINPAVFDLTINAKQKDDSYRITTHMSAAKMSGLLFSSVVMVIINIIFSTIGFSPDKDAAISKAEQFWNAFITMMMDFCFIAWQFFCGTREIGKIIDVEENVAYANRNRILKKYLLDTGKIQDENKLEQIIELLNKK